MARLQLSPPWDTYYEELNALFGKDKEVHVIFDEQEYEIKLYVDKIDKATALEELLPKTVEFGNVELKITVYPPNEVVRNLRSNDPVTLMETAFRNNPIVSRIKTATGIFKVTYIVFVKEVVQYFNDNIGDINGNHSTLYEIIARDIFPNMNGIYFCTEETSFIYSNNTITVSNNLNPAIIKSPF